MALAAPLDRSLSPTDPAARVRVGTMVMVAAMALFAVMAVLARMATRHMASPQLVVVRFALCAAGVLATGVFAGARLRPNNLRLLALRGLFGGLAVLLYFVALARCRDAGTATLLNFMSPIFTTVFAWLFLRERASARLILGGALAFVGVLVVLHTPAGIALGPGELAGFASAVLSGLAVTTIRAARAYDDAATILLAFSVSGMVIALPFAVPVWTNPDALTWALAVAVGVVSFFAQLGMTHALGLMPAAFGALFQQLTPVFTFALGAAFLGEPLSWWNASGALLALGAVCYAAMPKR